MIIYNCAEKLEQGYHQQAGTVLKRKDSLKNGYILLLFLRDIGPRWVIAPSGSTKNRFGGAVEPMTWGIYNIYQSPSALSLKSSVIKEDFLLLRQKSKQLYVAMDIYKTVTKAIFLTHECNSILNLLWSTMLLLKEGCISEHVEFRFIWRLLHIMGVAPSLQQCVICGVKLKNTFNCCADGFSCSQCESGESVDIKQLLLLQRAATLKQNDFIKWSILNSNNSNIFNRYTFLLKKNMHY